MNIDLKYVNTFTDRHGKVRHYFRHDGKRLRLPGSPGSPEFMQAYQTALAGDALPKRKADENRVVAGTVRAAVDAYYRSSVRIPREVARESAMMSPSIPI
jgi:hypothetical protein